MVLEFEYSTSDIELFKDALKILKHEFPVASSDGFSYGFVNKYFFQYHKRNKKLTNALINGKPKRFSARSLDEYHARNCYFTYNTSIDECDCPNFWIYRKCQH